MLQSNPQLCWRYLQQIEQATRGARPNAGHQALAELHARFERFTVLTQNVDGLHDRAGSRNILKVHGDLWSLRCCSCGRERVDLSESIAPLPPHCACGGVERPGVVWFGESLPRDVWARAEQAAREAQVFLVVGTSAVVYPAAGLVGLAKSSGAKVVEINIEETPVSGMVDASLRGSAAEILSTLAG